MATGWRPEVAWVNEAGWRDGAGGDDGGLDGGDAQLALAIDASQLAFAIEASMRATSVPGTAPPRVSVGITNTRSNASQTDVDMLPEGLRVSALEEEDRRKKRQRCTGLPGGEPHVGACAVCFSDYCEEILACDHSCVEHSRALCQACMRSHIAAQGPLPRCPMPGCNVELGENDLIQFGDVAAIASWREAILRKAIEELPGAKVVCPTEGCSMVVELDSSERQRICCNGCRADFCSQCHQSYHFRTACDDVQALRIRYAEWVGKGRAEHSGREADVQSVVSAQGKALEDARRRHEELRLDETLKAQTCKQCPHCSRVVQKLGGCDTMRCGYDPDTGANRQDGCWKQFSFSSAPSYASQLGAAPKPKPLPSGLEKLRAQSEVSHGDWRCDLCHGTILGLRFSCIHCPVFVCCSQCENKLDGVHPSNHVFEILEPNAEDVEAHIASSWVQDAESENTRQCSQCAHAIPAAEVSGLRGTRNFAGNVYCQSCWRAWN